MKKNIGNVFVIAHKEFADNLNNSRFILLLLIQTALFFSVSYRYAYSYDISDQKLFLSGLTFMVQITGLFLPLLGIALGFDTIVKERRSGSLNILLTHPVFRDTVISGKILGAMATLALAIAVSVMVSVGPMLVITGIQISSFELERIFLYTVVTFIYISTFLSLSIFLSIISKSTTDSFIYNLAGWINICFIYGAIIAMIASVITGQSILNLGNNDDALKFNSQMEKLTPTYHYAEITMGDSSLSIGGISVAGGTDKQSFGILDAGSTVNRWFADYLPNLVALVVMTIVLFIVSFVVFLRKDITM